MSTWPLSSPFFFSLRLFVLALLIPDWFTPAVVSRSEAIPSLSVHAWQVGSVLLWHRLSLTPFIWSFFLCSLLSSSSLWLINMSFFSFLLLRRFNFLLRSCSRAFSTGSVYFEVALSTSRSCSFMTLASLLSFSGHSEPNLCSVLNLLLSLFFFFLFFFNCPVWLLLSVAFRFLLSEAPTPFLSNPLLAREVEYLPFFEDISPNKWWMRESCSFDVLSHSKISKESCISVILSCNLPDLYMAMHVRHDWKTILMVSVNPNWLTPEWGCSRPLQLDPRSIMAVGKNKRLTKGKKGLKKKMWVL